MRICHVVECGGGVGNVILDLVEAGVAAGDDVTVIYSAARAWPQFVEKLKSFGTVKLIPLKMQRAVGLHDLADCLALYKTLRTAGPFDVINAHSSKAGALVRLLRFFLPKTALVYTPHAFMTMAPDASPIYGWIEGLLSKFCDAIICVSQMEKQHALKQLHISKRLLNVIPNGVDTSFVYDRASARERLGLTPSSFVVGFVGRLEAQKNPLLAVRVFAKAYAQRPNLKLVMVGYGALQPAVDETCKEAGISDSVQILHDLNARELIGGFDCLLCTSAYESFGLVILEALAAGVPVVTTPVGIAEDAITSSLMGKIAFDFDEKILVKGLIELCDADATRREQIAQATKAQAKKFDVKNMTQATRALYVDAMKAKGIRT